MSEQKELEAEIKELKGRLVECWAREPGACHVADYLTGEDRRLEAELARLRAVEKAALAYALSLGREYTRANRNPLYQALLNALEAGEDGKCAS